MKIKHIILLMIVFTTHGLSAQKLTLEDCLNKAEEKSPLTRQRLHYETLEGLTQKNVSNAYLPVLALNGQASFQSDVFSFPGNSLLDAPIIPKEQFRLTLDLNQKIYDGGMVKNKKIAESARILSESKGAEVDLYQIKSTISVLFFSALVYQQNIRILNSALSDLRQQQQVIDAQVANGLVLKSASNSFKKHVLSMEQQILEYELEQEATLKMLSKWIGEDITTSSQLEIPTTPISLKNREVLRPELQMLEAQKNYLESMKNMSSVVRRPTLWAVAQAGIGQPNAYNFLETDVADFYFVGLKMSWHIFDYGNAQRERSIFQTNQAIVDSKKEYLEDQIDNQLTKASAEVNKLGKLLDKDAEILALQEEIVSSAFSQVKNGVITSTDYLNELTTKTQLQLSQQIHLIQLKQAEYNWLNISGNL